MVIPDSARAMIESGRLAHFVTLNRDELAGVIAHELAHIKNRDTLTMTVTATMAGAISMLGNMLMFSSMTNNNRDNQGSAFGGIIAMIGSNI